MRTKITFTLVLLFFMFTSCGRKDVGEGFGPHSFEIPIDMRKINSNTAWVWFDDGCIAVFKGYGASSWLRKSEEHSG